MSEREPQLEITPDDSPSINDLVQFQAAGFSVLRSAHVGNFSPYNLAIIEAGIPLLCVDHTITGIDKNYRPENIEAGGEAARIAPMGKLVCRAGIDQLPEELVGICNGSAFVDQAHITSSRAIMGTEAIFSNTEYLRANESVVQEIVRMALAEFPQLFERIATSDGKALKLSRVSELVDGLGIMQLNDDPRAEKTAVIMPNLVDMLANFVIEALRSQQDTQFHLSGPDMVHHIKPNTPTLQNMYRRLVETASFGSQLPQQLKIRLVPTTSAKFVTTQARADRLDSLLAAMAEADAELGEIQDERKDFFSLPISLNKTARATFESEVKVRVSAIQFTVAEKLAAMPELMIEPKTAGHITQYDVMREGGLFVPDINRQFSMAELTQLSKKLGRVAGRFQL